MVTTADTEHPSSNPDPMDDDGPSISPRDSSILQAIQQEGLTVFTFDGLRRLLGLHQETLSRVLNRLEGDGLVEKVIGGYRVTPEGGELVPRALGAGSARVPMAQSLLPPDMDVGSIVTGLKGKWFGSLRWLGYSESEEGLVLKWITEDDGIQVDAKFANALLTIEARVGEGKDAGHAIRAAHELLGHVSRLYNRRPRAGTFATPVAYYPGLDFA